MNNVFFPSPYQPYSTVPQLYIGEAIWAFLFGVVIGKSEMSPFTRGLLISFTPSGPYGAGIFDPRSWGNPDTTNEITLELTRVVLAIGVFAVGVELPKAYMLKHWKSLLFLLIPVMTWVRVNPPFLSLNPYNFLRGGSFPLASFMPSFPNSTSSRLSPLLRASPQPTPFLPLPLWEESMPKNMSPLTLDTSWQQSAVATTEPPSPSYSFPCTSSPTTMLETPSPNGSWTCGYVSPSLLHNFPFPLSHLTLSSPFTSSNPPFRRLRFRPWFRFSPPHEVLREQDADRSSVLRCSIPFPRSLGNWNRNDARH